MERQEKKKFVAELHNRLEKAQGTFLVDYQGLNVEALSGLRRELKKIDTDFQVVKNRLLKLASEDTGTDMIKDHMQGPTAIVLTYEDVIAPAKVLVDCAKKLKQFEIKAGQISGKMLDAKAISHLAELPGREELLAHTLAAMQAVPAALVRVLNGVAVQLLNVLKAIEQQKEKPA